MKVITKPISNIAPKRYEFRSEHREYTSKKSPRGCVLRDGESVDNRTPSIVVSKICTSSL